MQQAELYARLPAIFDDLFNDPALDLQPEMTAADIPGWDSANHINLVTAVEAEFRISFQTVELETMHSVGSLAEAIERRLEREGR